VTGFAFRRSRLELRSSRYRSVCSMKKRHTGRAHSSPRERQSWILLVFRLLMLEQCLCIHSLSSFSVVLPLNHSRPFCQPPAAQYRCVPFRVPLFRVLFCRLASVFSGVSTEALHGPTITPTKNAPRSFFSGGSFPCIDGGLAPPAPTIFLLTRAGSRSSLLNRAHHPCRPPFFLSSF